MNTPMKMTDIRLPAGRTRYILPLAAIVLAAACSDASSPLRVVPAEPVRLTAVSGGGQAGVVGRSLERALVVELHDRFGNPVPNVPVTWVVTDGDGSLPAQTRTGNDGRASAEWQLGTRAGEPQSARAEVDGALVATFSASAAAGAPASVLLEAGEDQFGTRGALLNEQLVVRVVDEFANPVPEVAVSWRALTGGGTMLPPTTFTSPSGIASARWQLGPEPGVQVAEAQVAGVSPGQFLATAAELTLTFAATPITQGSQALDGRVPLVAGRDGYLRVFLTADAQVSGIRPVVRAYFYHGATLAGTLSASASTNSVPLAVDESQWTGSWNIAVPGSLLQPGTRLRLELDSVPPGNNIATELNLDVRSVPPFRTTLVPVRHSGSGHTGNATETNKHGYMTLAHGVYPFPSYDVAVRAVFTTDVPDLSQASYWSQILNEIRLLRIADGAARYYYGVLRHVSPAYCGLGYLGHPAAIGTDQCGASTAAHEWGHNFGRLHTPCGNPGNLDPDYPYANARLGVFGLDVATATLKDPEQNADLMAYCNPRWISDYTYNAVLAFRQAEAGTMMASTGNMEASLVVWGRIENGRAVLEPSYVAETRPHLPEAPGPHTLELLDGTGARLYTLSFTASEVADIEGEHRHFAFAIPLRLLPLDRVRSLRLSGGGAAPAFRVSTGAVPAAAAVAVRRVGAERARVEWNEQAFPLVVVRDPATRQILALARNGQVDVASDATELEVIVSDGVRSARQRLPVRP
jgi:hypothetical protein